MAPLERLNAGEQDDAVSAVRGGKRKPVEAFLGADSALQLSKLEKEAYD